MLFSPAKLGLVLGLNMAKHFSLTFELLGLHLYEVLEVLELLGLLELYELVVLFDLFEN